MQLWHDTDHVLFPTQNLLPDGKSFETIAHTLQYS